MPLLPRDFDLMWALSTAVREFEVRQVAAFWGLTPQAARSRLYHLENAGWVRRVRITAREVPSPAALLWRWRPGQAPPPMGKLSHRARARYSGRATKSRDVYLPTTKTLDQFGFPRRRRPYQHAHDLGLAEAFLWFLGRWPRLTRHAWRGEDTFAPRGYREKTEDALLVHPKGGKPILAIEYVTGYQKNRLVELHRDLNDRNLGYALVH